ncbi:MAG: HlyD family efflux transporter periplasmic adaptor subunit [Polyangiales bacterium]
MSARTPYRVAAFDPDRAAWALVRTPRAARLVARLLLAFVAASAVVLAVTPWQQSAAGAGRVVAYAPTERQQTLEAPIEGRVTRWLVREGSRVRAGDRVVEITDNDPAILTRLGEERAAVVARREAARARAQSIASRAESLEASRRAAIAAAALRTRMAQDRARAATQALAAAEAAHETARLNVDRQRGLSGQGLSSTRAVELAELEFIRTRTEVDRARATLSAARSEESAVAADAARVGTDGAASIDDARASRASALAEEASASAELARIEVRLARQTTQSVTAPRDGTILRLVGGQGGEVVKAGDALAVLVPDTDARAVELWLDGNDVPLVSEGRHVRIQFEGWPAVQFVGWPSVAAGTFGGRVALVDSTDNGQGKFRVLIVPDGREAWPSGRYLRQGVRANGWVLLNRVRLGYELWRRFNGFPPVVSPREPAGANPTREAGK